MTDDIRLVAVKATKRDYYGLRHPATGDPLDDHGEAIWPNDANTHRMVQDGALRVVEKSSLRAFAPPEEPVAEPHKVSADSARARKG